MNTEIILETVIPNAENSQDIPARVEVTQGGQYWLSVTVQDWVTAEMDLRLLIDALRNNPATRHLFEP
jgi:hypothetical protein